MVNIAEIPPSGQGICRTRITLAILDGYYRTLYIRSSLGKLELSLLEGLIDFDYCREVMIIVINYSIKSIKLEEGDRITQIVFTTNLRTFLKEVDYLPGTVKEDKGFRSTGSIYKIDVNIRRITEHQVYKKEVNINQGLHPDQQELAKQLIQEYSDLTTIEHSNLPAITTHKYDIDVGDHPPI